MLSNPLAPALHQLWDSSLTHLMTMLEQGCSPLKTQRLRWFQMTQAPRMIKELRPFDSPLYVGPPGTATTPSHQTSKEEVARLGARCCKRTVFRIWNHTSREKMQETSRWFRVSSWSHNGQRWGWGSPFLARRSAVQQRPWATSHMKNLHCPGAQAFQILSQGLNVVDPKKKPAYAELVE